MTRQRVRADQLLVARGQCESRAAARALILAGCVFRGESRITKAGTLLPDDTELHVRRPPHPWVSRGGIKLAHALDHFQLDPAGAVAIDVGASTGGFTDVLLQRGARRVYAVDVGYGQLAWKLQRDPRVTVLDRTNARYLNGGHVPETADLVVCDASFISLAKVLPAPLALTHAGARLVALVKPQFEVGRADVGKGGIVRNAAARARAVAGVVRFLSDQPDWHMLGQTESPIEGADGNRESLVAAVRSALRPDTAGALQGAAT
jgi:23S rRNA (cytidine1920-2'-O)/16S rRNA (cytidine1409-2'-O)-methyltransferase